MTTFLARLYQRSTLPCLPSRIAPVSLPLLLFVLAVRHAGAPRQTKTRVIARIEEVRSGRPMKYAKFCRKGGLVGGILRLRLAKLSYVAYGGQVRKPSWAYLTSPKPGIAPQHQTSNYQSQNKYFSTSDKAQSRRVSYRADLKTLEFRVGFCRATPGTLLINLQLFSRHVFLERLW